MIKNGGFSKKRCNKSNTHGENFFKINIRLIQNKCHKNVVKNESITRSTSF